MLDYYQRQSAPLPGNPLRTAAEPDDTGPDDHVEAVVRMLRERYPSGFQTGGPDEFQVTWGDDVSEKRLRDLLLDSAAGRENPAQEDVAVSRVRQARPRQLPVDPDHEFLRDEESWNRSRKL